MNLRLPSGKNYSSGLHLYHCFGENTRGVLRIFGARSFHPE